MARQKKPITFSGLKFELVADQDGPGANIRPETPFSILVLGDFSGRASRGVCEPLSGRRIMAIDRDEIDEVMEKLKVRLTLDLAGEQVDLTFSSREDFHPDSLFAGLDIFRELKDTRRKLADPRTAGAALAAQRELVGSGGDAPKPKTQPVSAAASGSLLDQMLGQESAPQAAAPGGDLQGFLDQVVKPHLVTGKDPQHDKLEAALDAYITEVMRVLLHDRLFQALEAAWRGLDFLVGRVETGEALKLLVADISQEELAQDLLNTEDPAATGLFQLLKNRGRSAEEPLALLAGLYCFDHADAPVLGRISDIARAIGAPFVAQAHAHLTGCDDVAATPAPRDWRYAPDEGAQESFEELRHLPGAAWLGLAAPRFLLRLPFGADTDPVEGFSFEELDAESGHDDYLWGNPGLVVAYLLARSFELYEWDLKPGAVRDVDGLPLHVIKGSGEKRLQPCAEVQLSDQAIEDILDKGIMVLASLGQRDTVRLVRFQSLADPPCALAGCWDNR